MMKKIHAYVLAGLCATGATSHAMDQQALQRVIEATIKANAENTKKIVSEEIAKTSSSWKTNALIAVTTAVGAGLLNQAYPAVGKYVGEKIVAWIDPQEAADRDHHHMMKHEQVEIENIQRKIALEDGHIASYAAQIKNLQEKFMLNDTVLRDLVYKHNISEPGKLLAGAFDKGQPSTLVQRIIATDKDAQAICAEIKKYEKLKDEALERRTQLFQKLTAIQYGQLLEKEQRKQTANITQPATPAEAQPQFPAGSKLPQEGNRTEKNVAHKPAKSCSKGCCAK